VTVQVLTQASLASLLAMLVSTTPMLMGIVYAIRPNEHRLALMRPLSLAGIFAALANICLGLVNALVFIATRAPSDASPPALATRGLAEALVMPYIGFACLTIGWLGVAIGMRKAPL
jgi:hypothetical protein